MKQIEGQICLDDYVIRIHQGIVWKDFNEHCIHRGWLKLPQRQNHQHGCVVLLTNSQPSVGMIGLYAKRKIVH